MPFEIDIVRDRLLVAASDAHRLFVEAQHWHNALMCVRQSIYECYKVGLLDHEPYTKNLVDAIRDCERIAQQLQDMSKYAEQYEVYWRKCGIPMSSASSDFETFRLSKL
mgnify:CR=1 FL=1